MGGHAVDIASPDYLPRRTVYGFVERQNLPGMFRTFDFASPDTTSAQRFMTTVPQQALFFMNSPFALDQARSLMSRPDIARRTDVRSRVTRLYETIFQRPPEEAEVRLAQRFLARSAQNPARLDSTPIWQYGYGVLDPATQLPREFRRLPHFTGAGWQGGRQLPDPQLGWLLLEAGGGHPGGIEHGAAIRRWTAPMDAVLDIAGRLRHPSEVGDGVRARAISSRQGVLAEWRARNGSVETRVADVRVSRGDTIDFVVDCLENENGDGFGWAPRLETAQAAALTGPAVEWNARSDFGGRSEQSAPLTAWERYAQVLLMSNEAAFLD
jgi:hypothetical protein